MKTIGQHQYPAEVLRAKGTVLFVLLNPHCMVCRMVEPWLRQLERRFPEVSFVEATAGDAPELFRQLEPERAPLIQVFQDGAEIYTCEGVPDKHKIEHVLLWGHA